MVNVAEKRGLGEGEVYIKGAAEALGMSQRTLRELEREGMVRPARSPGGRRIYTPADLDELRRRLHEYVGTKEAAEIIGYKFDSSVKALIARGVLPAEKDGRRWLIRRDALRGIRKKRGGRPSQLDRQARGKDDDGKLYRSKVRAELDRRGLPYEWFWTELGIGETLFYRVERDPDRKGWRRPSVGYREGAARLLNLPVAELFEEIEEPVRAAN